MAWAGIGQYTDQISAYAFMRFMGIVAGGGTAFVNVIDAVEKAEIQRLWQPYFEQLPEYEYLREELTSEWP